MCIFNVCLMVFLFSGFLFSLFGTEYRSASAMAVSSKDSRITGPFILSASISQPHLPFPVVSSLSLWSAKRALSSVCGEHWRLVERVNADQRQVLTLRHAGQGRC